jgi:hypothetical protein
MKERRTLNGGDEAALGVGTLALTGIDPGCAHENGP